MMTRLTTMSALMISVAFGPAFGQVSSEELAAISIPDKVETAIGTLEFFDGVPTDATVATVYDNLDRMRGMQVFLDNVGAVSMYSVRKGLADAGAEGANRIAVFEGLLDSQTVMVTANTSTLYAFTYTDLAKDGPTVIEVPPMMLGFLDDGWQRFIGNMGVTGPDQGKGGKYLVVPPDYAGDIPDGYFLLKPPTNRNFMFLRGLVENGLEPAVENITSHLRVYPLKDARARPRPNSSTCRTRRSTRSFPAISRISRCSTRSSRKNRSTPSARRCAEPSHPSASSRVRPSRRMTE
jgi:hypothetical protein